MKYIDKERIPKSEGNVMAATLFSTISNYFADPKHQQEFEEWQRSKGAPGQLKAIQETQAPA